jgi:hypothetical protein
MGMECNKIFVVICNLIKVYLQFLRMIENSYQLFILTLINLNVQ